jgi:hypothetical protein
LGNLVFVICVYYSRNPKTTATTLLVLLFRNSFTLKTFLTIKQYFIEWKQNAEHKEDDLCMEEREMNTS